MTRQALLDEALKLPANDRADVAEQLLASLPDAATEEPETVACAWGEEIERRARRVLSGESPGIPWQQTLDRVAARLTNS